MSLSLAELTVDEGERENYTLELDQPPPNSVTVVLDIVEDKVNVVAIQPPNLTFTSSNWNVPQTITVEALQDVDLADDNAVITHSVEGFLGDAVEVIVNVIDDDRPPPGITITPSSAELTIDEGGMGEYAVVLDTQPSGNVTVSPESTDSGAVTVSRALTFTPQNWSAEQTVMVTGVQDDDGASETVTVTHGVSGYGDVASADSVTVTVTDDDTPGVTVTPTSLAVSEGGTGEYAVALNTRPSGNVTVSPESTDSGVVTVSRALTFTPQNWSAEQTVTVTGVQDDDGASETVTVTHGVSGYGDVASADSVTVTVTDDDTPGVTVTPTSLAVSEGGTGEYAVALNTRPSGNVTVSPESTDSGVVTVSRALTFTPQNWSAEQTVMVTGVQDDDGASETVTVTHGVSGYGDVASADSVTVTVTDDDTPGVTVTPTSLAVSEGGTGEYAVALNTRPSGNVTVSPESTDSGVVTVSRALTFTPQNWSAEQTVTVTGVQDDDGAPETVTVTHGVSGYGDVASADSVTVTVTDDDTPGVDVSTPTLTDALTIDEGGSTIYSVSLDTAPEADVTVRPQSSSPDHVSVSPTTLTFTLGNWRTPQSVTVTAREDDHATDGATVTLTHAVTGYGSVTDGGSLTITVRDNDAMDEEEKEAVTETLAAVASAAVSNVTSNIGARFSGTGTGTSLTVAGQLVTAGQMPTRLTVPAIVGAHGDSDFPSELDSGSQSLVTLDDLLRSSAFHIALGAADEDTPGMNTGPLWTMWGRGDLQFFASDPDRGSSYDGDLKGGYLGIDMGLGEQWLAGLAVSRIVVESDYGLEGSSADDDGRLDVTLTNVHPYLRFTPDAASELWAILGAGRGDIDNARKRSSVQEKGDVKMWMASAGGRRALETAGDMDWTLLGDVGFARVETDDGLQAIAGLTVDSWRIRLGVEGSYTAVLEGDNTLTSFAEVAVRGDGGDSGEEAGLEMSPGLYFSAPGSGFGIEARGRALVLHSAENYEEYGASVTASLSPGSNGLGLSMSVSPRWGAGTTTGADVLWGDDGFGSSGSGLAVHEALSLETRVAYGVAVKRGVLTPFGEIDLQERGRRRVRMGARFSSTGSGPGELSLELSGDRYESRGSDSDHRVGVAGRWRF